MAKPTQQEIDDLRNQKKIDEAYEKSLRNTEMAPAPTPKTPASAPKKMAKGGYVRAADGCAQRGKTRGKYL